jgi:hypothetical protein
MLGPWIPTILQLEFDFESLHPTNTMSFYFAIIGTKDNPLFEHEFGTSKQGGDGIARFREEQRHMNQFIVHSSLDIVEEVQWGTGSMYVAADSRPWRKLAACISIGIGTDKHDLGILSTLTATQITTYPPS